MAVGAGSTDVVVRFIGDSSSLQNEAAKVESTGSKIKSWAKGVGLAIAGAFAVNFAKDAINAASDLQETMSKTETVFGKSAGAIKKWSEGSAQSMGLSQQAALDAASGFQTMLTGLDIAPDVAQDISKEFVTMSADLASFHNVAGGAAEVTDMIGAAMRGEYDSLQRLIPGINAAAVEQRAMANSGKTSAKELTAAEKAAATYGVILEGMGPAAGDFARTSDGMANQQRIMSAEFDNTKAKLGQALMPVMTEAMGVLGKLAGFVKDNTSWLIPLAAAIAAVVVAVKLWTIAQAVFNAVMAANPIVLIVAGIALLIGAIILAYQKVDWFRAGVDAMWQAVVAAFNFVKDAAVAVFNWIKDNWPLLLAILLGPFGIALGLIINNWDTIKNAAAALFNWVRDRWSDIVNAISGAARTIGTIVSGIVTTFNTIKDAATAVWQWVSDKFNAIAGIISGVKDAISTAASSVAGVIKSPVNAVIRAWNRLEFKVPEVDLGPFGKIGGQSWSPPNITELAKGGIVTGPTLALIGERGPEAVIPLSRGGNSMANSYTINVNVGPGSDPVQAGRQIVELIRAHERANGRAWRDIA